jgi:hypothetical protein
VIARGSGGHERGRFTRPRSRSGQQVRAIRATGGVDWPLAVQTQSLRPWILSGTPRHEKGHAMHTDVARLVGLERPSPGTDARLHLTVCPICMRVQRGSEWLEAEQVIRDIRSYELDELPELSSTVCDPCVESIYSRRMDARRAAAA